MTQNRSTVIRHIPLDRHLCVDIQMSTRQNDRQNDYRRRNSRPSGRNDDSNKHDEYVHHQHSGEQEHVAERSIDGSAVLGEAGDYSRYRYRIKPSVKIVSRNLDVEVRRTGK